MDTPMCNTCSIETNRAAWANYPEMLDLCKMCESFQLAIQKTIEEAESIQKRLQK
jgi:hypothetical protein